MSAARGDCGECEAEALSRVLVVRDSLDLILWGEAEPLPGIDGAVAGLRRARAAFEAAGWEAGA